MKTEPAVKQKLMKGNLLKGGQDEVATPMAVKDLGLEPTKLEGVRKMDEMGLAGQVGQQPQKMPAIGLQEVVAMLMQGVDPEELMEAGVPQELVEAAMQEVAKQMQGQVQGGPEQQGLAGMQAMKPAMAMG